MHRNTLRKIVAKWYITKADEPYSFADDLVSICLDQVLLKLEKENLEPLTPEALEALVLTRWFNHTQLMLATAEIKLAHLRSL